MKKGKLNGKTFLCISFFPRSVFHPVMLVVNSKKYLNIGRNIEQFPSRAVKNSEEREIDLSQFGGSARCLNQYIAYEKCPSFKCKSCYKTSKMIRTMGNCKTQCIERNVKWINVCKFS